MILFYILLTLSGFVYLAETNSKRRRAFNQPPIGSRKWVWPARIAVIFPAIIMLVFQDWSAFSIWAGAVTVFGWIIAAVSPVTLEKFKQASIVYIKEKYASLSQQSEGGLLKRITGNAFFANSQESSRENSVEQIKALEARIASLEVKLASFEVQEEVQKNSQDPPLKVVRRN